jgi:nitric oxide reductase NorQ protein
MSHVLEGLETMSNFFSREARTTKYRLLREIFVNTKGEASFEHCHKSLAAVGIVVSKADWSAIKHQYKNAIAAGETPIPAPAPIPAMEEPAPEPVMEEPEPMDEPEMEEFVPAPAPKKPAAEYPEWVKAKFMHTVDPHFTFDTNLKNYLNGIEQMSRDDFAAGKPSAAIRLVGHQGCGKTSMAIQFAAKTKRPCVIIDCMTLREGLSLFGNKTVDKDGLKWVNSLFVNAIRIPRMEIVMDEINRLSPMTMNTLLPLLDSRGETYLDESKEEIKVAAGVTIFSTCNEGSQFTGTDQMDSALCDRFCDLIPINYLSEPDESLLLQRKHGLDKVRSDKLALVAKTVRAKFMASEVYTKSISTRLLENAAKKLAKIGACSLEYSLVSHFVDDGSKDSERSKIRELLKGSGLSE